MKNVLIISYFYPPIGGAGIIRTLKFSKYLSKYDWNPHILTVKNRDRFHTSAGNDEVPDGVHVHRSKNYLNNLSIVEGGLRRFGVTSKVIVPDVYRGWIYDSVRMGKRIIEEEGIDLIYVSCPPYSSAIIGARLKEITGTPFVLDLRDAWTLNPYSNNYLFNSLKKYDENLEKQIFKSADFLILNTNEIELKYVQKYPFIQSKTVTINNGFDFDDIPKHPAVCNNFTIVYTGFFYGVQSPEILFRALKWIISHDIIPKEDIQFLWAGRSSPFANELVNEFSVSEITNYLGLLSKREADELIYSGNLLYLVLGGSKDVNQEMVIPNKLFPYVASGIPILALVTESSTKKFLEQYSDNSYIITSWDVDEVIEAIVDAYKQWKSNTVSNGKKDKYVTFRNTFNNETLTKKLASVFDLLYYS